MLWYFILFSKIWPLLKHYNFVCVGGVLIIMIMIIIMIIITDVFLPKIFINNFLLCILAKKYLSRVCELLPFIANASLQRRLNMANTANELITLDISNYVNYTSCYEQGLCLSLFITVAVWTGL